MAASVSLVREGFGIELRRGRFSVLVDGRDVGSIDSHQAVEMPLEPGRHTIQIRAGRYSSRLRTFEVGDGQMATFRCHGANVWPLYVASIFKPDLAISLKRL
ncbi:MAG TPA: hypothetical protein VKU88_09155 [Acidimicrobiales bacterium]|nr:hypothetical protein [Acidimicrobiales bacterium]